MKFITEKDQADSGASRPELEQGYTKPQEKKTGFMRTDFNGDTYEGNMYERGGFLGRPQGWQR